MLQSLPSQQQQLQYGIQGASPLALSPRQLQYSYETEGGSAGQIVGYSPTTGQPIYYPQYGGSLGSQPSSQMGAGYNYQAAYAAGTASAGLSGGVQYLYGLGTPQGTYDQTESAQNRLYDAARGATAALGNMFVQGTHILYWKA